MASCVVVGAQWGDEGKGKLVDLFADRADLVVRFQGGNNAGHTLVVNGPHGPVKTIVHLIPSGILHPSTRCLIASGVVVDLRVFFRELDQLAAAGLDTSPERLSVSRDAHVILPTHCALDVARESRLQERRIGTTGRGIGPAYEDRVGRRGIRLRDLGDAQGLRQRVRDLVAEHNALLRWLESPEQNADEVADALLAWWPRLQPHLVDGREVLHHAMAHQHTVLFEGAQGVMLDIAHGTYPYVTSSHTVSGGVCVGAGIAPRQVGPVLGIAKAYCTRVGGGPFPTELHGELGDRIRAQGHEFGSTTGRPRRCGWFDAVALRSAHQVSGFDGLAITKLDVLTGLPEVRICTGYQTPDGVVTHADADADSLAHAEPVWETLPGWDEPISHARTLEELPLAARHLLDRITAHTGIPVWMVSVGAERNETIVLRDPFGPAA
jgi:adenylosuccinate synthase